MLDQFGNDLTVVNAARVSYGKRSDVMDEKAAKLINYLLRNRHGSPFEHVVFTFRVKAPLFVVHQWERHRMASYNEESGRYRELDPEFYTPTPIDKLAADNAYNLYKTKLANGFSKEDARTVLPISLYKSFWFTVNARSLMNFLSLRNDEHAQAEIRAYAHEIELMFAEAMPVTWRAFHENGRRAP